MSWVCWLMIGLLSGLSIPISTRDSAAASDKVPTVAKLFYYEFEAHSTFAITEANIEKNCPFYIQLLSGLPKVFDSPIEHPFLTKLTHILTRTPGSDFPEEGFIRLKLKFLDETFLVDANGRVLRAKTGERFHLSVQEMKKIGHDIESLAGIVDMNSIRFYEQESPK